MQIAYYRYSAYLTAYILYLQMQYKTKYIKTMIIKHIKRDIQIVCGYLLFLYVCKHTLICYLLFCACTAVNATTPTISSQEHPRDRSLTGLAIPCNIGP